MRHRTLVDHLMDLNILRRSNELIRGVSFLVVGLWRYERQMVENDWLIFYLKHAFIYRKLTCLYSA